MAQNKKLIKSVSHLHPKIREGGKTSSDYSHAASFRTGVGYDHGRVEDGGGNAKVSWDTWRAPRPALNLLVQRFPLVSGRSMQKNN